MMARRVLPLFFFLVFAIACTQAPASPTPTPVNQEVTIFAASSLTDPFNEIGKKYAQIHPGVRLVFNFASSDELARQLAQGAAGDVFASASGLQMDNVVAAGRVDSGKVETFSSNRLTVIFPAANPANITRLQDLGRPGVRLMLAASETPIGQYSLAFLQNASQSADFGADFQANALANVVSYQENVREVLGKVAKGEADAGIVYASDIAQVPGDILGHLEIPAALNVEAVYVVAPLSAGTHPQAAADFIAYLLSDEGQDLLGQYGFLPVR